MHYRGIVSGRSEWTATVLDHEEHDVERCAAAGGRCGLKK
jgi:hypothetical protein